MKHALLETRRQAVCAVIGEYPGGRDCAAARLGLTVKKFDNHAYENAGSRPLNDEQIYQLEQDTGTTHLPSYVCHLYGGVFVKLDDVEALDNTELYARTVNTAAKRAKVDLLIAAALEDGVITEHELEGIIAAHHAHIAARHEEVGAVIQLHQVQR